VNDGRYEKTGDFENGTLRRIVLRVKRKAKRMAGGAFPGDELFYFFSRYGWGPRVGAGPGHDDELSCAMVWKRSRLGLLSWTSYWTE
jgi:hypothetical protein